jgi:hypothetical protein
VKGFIQAKNRKNYIGSSNQQEIKVKSAASGNYSHHLLLSRGNSHHRRKTQYIGGLIYGYCLYCYKLFIYGRFS